MLTLFRIALRNVLRNRRRTLITLGALFVGVGVMVSMRGLLNGLQRALVENVSRAQTGAVQVHRKGYMDNVLSTPLTLDFPVEEALAAITRQAGVVAAAPRINFAGMLAVGDAETTFVALMAVDPARELAVTPMRTSAFSPGQRLFAAPGGTPPLADGVILSGALIKATGLKAGGEAALLSPDRDGALSGENVHLAGTMHLTAPGEKKIALLPLAVAQRLLKMEGRATEIAVAIDSPERADAVAAALRARLGPTYEVHTWADVAFFVRQAMQRQNFVISFVAGAFMFLMLLGVANTMLMSVVERTREIGTMMAVGLRAGRIRTLFITEALMLGLLGGIGGSAAGALVVALLGRRGITFTFPGSQMPFVLTPYITPAYLGGVVLLAALGAAAFALYPAFRASRLRPVQALAGA